MSDLSDLQCTEDVEARAHAIMDPVPYFVCHIDCPFGQARAGLPTSCIRAFPNGFAVAGADSCLAVWRQDKDKAEDADEILSGPSYKYAWAPVLQLL